MTDLTSGSAHLSAECCRIFGIEPGKPTSFDVFLSHVHPDDRSRVVELRDAAIASGSDYEQRHRIVRDDGDVRTIVRRATVLRDDFGRACSILGVVQDVTDEAQRVEALKVSEAQYRRLVESGIVGVAIADLAGRVHEANDTYLATLKYSREDLARGEIDCQRTTPPELRESCDAAFSELRIHGAVPPWEKELVAKDGARVPVLLGMAMIDDSRCVTIVVDLSKRKAAEEALRRTEEQFRQAQKMESIGVLAGGVAHDFNNLLSVILSYSELLLEQLGPQDPIYDDLLEIQSAGRRATDLTRQLLAFSRRQLLQPRHLDMNQTVAGMEKMLRRVLGEDIVLSIEMSNENACVRADPGQLEQVIMNLGVNARDAMPDGGKLTIATGATEVEGARASALGLKPGPYVTLSVEDTGTGMDPETKARAVEPFFTTKPKDRGTGLGLSTVLGIAQQSGGGLAIESELGKGTTFLVYLPRTENTPEVNRAPPAPVSRPRTGATVLLVDDDDSVRNVVARVLRSNGYLVLEGQNAGEALLHCEQHSGPIHLLLTDVVMPLMDGPRMAERLLKMCPDMRVIYMSGYADRAVQERAISSASGPLLQKPVTPNEILRLVESVLEPGEPSRGERMKNGASHAA